MKRLHLSLVAVVAFSFAGTASAKPQPAFNPGKEVVEVVGKVVITCVRPSTLLADNGYEPKLIGHRISSSRAGRINVEIKIRWYGALTQTPYTSDVTVKILADRTGVEILGIDYTDDCLFPAPDQRLVQAAIREINKVLSDNFNKR